MSDVHRRLDPSELRALLKAAPSDPLLSISVVGQTVFCPRAGLLTLEFREAKLDQEVPEEDRPHLDYLPDYEEALIEAEINRYLSEAIGVIVVQLLLGVLASVVYQLFSTQWGLMLVLLQVPGLTFLFHHLLGFLELKRRLSEFRNAKVGINIPELGQKEETVNWWSLRKAGFEVRKLNEPHNHDSTKLVGCPFRELKFQSLLIPVLRKHRGKLEVHLSHRVMLAGYCWLIEQSTGSQAPFGVLLFHDSYEVVIVPNDRRNQQLFVDGVQQARQIANDAAHGAIPGEPRHNPCIGCHFGNPVEHHARKSDLHLGKGLGSLNRFWSRRARKWFHSVCGDRFCWKPRHDRAEILELEQE